MKKICWLIALMGWSVLAAAQWPTVADFTKNMTRTDGYIPLYWQPEKGKLYAEISRFNEELLYYPSLAQGVGSNDIGLDRGRLSAEHVLKFELHGNKILMVEPNYAYRAISEDKAEKLAVEQSFAKSIHYGFEVVARSGDTYLIDLTPFVLQDAVQAIEALAETNQGTYRLDASRSAIYMPQTKGFPKNTEIETIITLVGSKPGNFVQEVVPTPTVISMHQHHSFVQLPDNQYKPREFDPRIGYFGIDYFDYATPFSEPIRRRLIARHRLQKKDPNAMVSEAVQPIIYYLDPGTPEPIRSALMDGARWWNQAFEYAGYKDAFQVKLLPEDADPMDVRYNVIQWVHRSTRGWSYGASITDPRTGEIIKGKVTLGSLRVRQDYLIAQGLLGNFTNDTTRTSEMREMALQRLRQLAAHEVGHTLGLPHNYIASAQGRASVMDYPHPVVEEVAGKLTLKNAYTQEIGEYDKISINWGYQDFPKGSNEKQELERIVNALKLRGLTFLTDQDARPDGSVHPQTHLWDNGPDAVAELRRLMGIRRRVLNEFDEKKIRMGEPMATLEEVMVPMYMFHRFQVQAVAKAIGGGQYQQAVRGDVGIPYLPVSPKEQLAATNALLETLTPDFLALPPKILNLIPPRPYRFDPNPREVFKRRTGMAFDPLAPAEASAGLSLSLLLHPERANRLAVQKVYFKDLPDLKEVLSMASAKLIRNPQLYAQNGYAPQLERLVAGLYLNHLVKLYQTERASFETKSIVLESITQLKNFVETRKNTPFGNYLAQQIAEFLAKPSEVKPTLPLSPPDGQPIDEEPDWLSCGSEK